MAVTYYYGDPRQFHGYSALRDENSLLDYWFYPNRMYMEEVRKENQKQEDENKKKGEGKQKGGGGGGGGGGDGNKGKENKGEGGDGKEKKGGGGKDDNKAKVIELRVPLCCEACARRVRKKIQKLEGVERGGVTTDMYENRVTVKATVKEEVVLKQAQKVKRDAQLWPKKKEPENKKKEGDKKGGGGGGGGNNNNNKGGGGGDNKNNNKDNHD